MAELTQLVYVSRRPAGLTTACIVDDIVLPSMKRNLAADITGCLWFGAEHFLQVLEGEAGAVHALFDRIARDPRHRDVRVICDGPIADRAFVRFSLRHIESDETDEVGRLVERYAPPALVPSDPPVARDEDKERDVAATDLIVAAVARLRAILLL